MMRLVANRDDGSATMVVLDDIDAPLVMAFATVELLLVGVDPAPPELDGLSGALAGRLRWLQASQGRAVQQNGGAGAGAFSRR